MSVVLLFEAQVQPGRLEAYVHYALEAQRDLAAADGCLSTEQLMAVDEARRTASANAVPASVGTSPFPVRVKSCAPMPSSSFRRRRLTAEVVKCAASPLADKLRVRMRIKRRRRSESS